MSAYEWFIVLVWISAGFTAPMFLSLFCFTITDSEIARKVTVVLSCIAFPLMFLVAMYGFYLKIIGVIPMSNC